MKNLLFVIIILFFSTTLFSQHFAESDNSRGSSSYYQSNLNKRFYIRVGYSIPSWNYYGFNNADELKSTIGVKSRTGANLDVGSIFMLHGINVGEKFRFGINVDWISFKAQIFNKEKKSNNLYNFFIGSKVGPSFTYAPARALAMDVFFKINPIWAATIYDNHVDFESGLDLYYGYLQMMYSVGFNVRISVLIIGIEYDFGSLKLQNQEESELWPNYGDINKSKTPMNGTNLTIGLNF